MSTSTNSKVIITDIETSNGVIHVIDAVLLPPAEDAMMEEKNTIVDIAVADGRFNTLVAAVASCRFGRDFERRRPLHRLRPN